jgi:hypothetical protein
MCFSAGVMLLMRIWSGKRAKLTTDVEKDMEDVQKCLDYLKVTETRQVSYFTSADFQLSIDCLSLGITRQGDNGMSTCAPYCCKPY